MPTHFPTPDDWNRISALTAGALEQPEAERAAWLDRECAGHDNLRREVDSLLAADARAGRFLEKAAIAEPGAAEAVDATARGWTTLAAEQRVGPYRIVRELGHGGMGIVYLAERADAAFEKQVAIKIVRGGLASEPAVARFADERRILATLEHPGIARLLDAGVTSDGLPYLVMEYVDGIAIDEYCDTAKLSLQERLELFRRVCAPVQYAHQRLVIHRDIKPRNILVASGGTPKLLDFGIAKLLEQDGSGTLTQMTIRAFTFENASPEQVRGEPMTVASDVYALGVLLYRLVTGERPYGPVSNNTALFRAICETPPIPPAVAARDGTHFSISAELEWVILKALRKEPERRYESVEQFAEDVRRLLVALPVLAAPDSRRYRAGKFVARHRLGVIAGMLLILSLVGGLAATLWQARRASQQRALAEARLQDTRRLANAMVFELNDALEAGSTSARSLLLTRAAEQLDALAAAAPSDAVLANELATAYHRLGDVLGGTAGSHVGDRKTGLVNHRKALAIRRAQAEAAPGDLEARDRLADSLMMTAYAEDDVEPSFELAHAAVAVAQSLVTAQPSEIRYIRRLASAHYTLGSQYRSIGDTPHALQSFEAATPLFEQIYKVAPDADLRANLALCHKRLGAILVDREQYAAALTHLATAVDLDTISLSERPTALARRRALSVSNTQLGFAYLNSGHPSDALPPFERALALREGISHDDPSSAQGPKDVAVALWYIGLAQHALGDHTTAIATFQRALPLAGSADFRGDQLSATIRSALGEAYEAAGQRQRAVDSTRLATRELHPMLAAQPRNATIRTNLARSDLQLATMLRKQADADRARRATLRQEACTVLADGRDALIGMTGKGNPVHERIAESIRQGLEQCGQTALRKK
jgi:eukaryotic-like serine/threonine-protein kinase